MLRAACLTQRFLSPRAKLSWAETALQIQHDQQYLKNSNTSAANRQSEKEWTVFYLAWFFCLIEMMCLKFGCSQSTCIEFSFGVQKSYQYLGTMCLMWSTCILPEHILKSALCFHVKLPFKSLGSVWFFYIKIILLFSKDALNWSKVIVKIFIMS